MEELLVTAILSLCSKPTYSGCQDAQDYMVNCAIVGNKEITSDKIKECAKEFKDGKRYEEDKK